MKNDFLEELEYIGFTARIKRISDGLMYDARKVYEDLELGIEPNWHLVFLLLKKEKQMTVTEIAQTLKFSHPAIIKITKKMKIHGYVLSHTDASDSRKQLIQLSEKGLAKLPIFEKEWLKIETLVKEFVDDELLRKLNELEHKLNAGSLFERHKRSKE